MNRYAWLGRMAVVGALALLPVVAAAQVTISEIMYDASGTDTDHEWVEVYNSGSESVDLTSWRFFEASTAHELSVVSGDGVIAPGEWAIIAANPSFFSSEWGSSTDLFDSSFSLSNTGETIALEDADLNTVDAVSYLSGWGAAGDGTSLQKLAGSWQTGVPTPGQANVASAPASEDSDQGGSSTGITYHVAKAEDNGTQDKVELTNTEKDIAISIGADRTVLLGAEQSFTAQVENYHRSDITYTWNFGDGTRVSGGEDKQTVHYAWQYPGTYVVVVEVSGSGYRTEDRATVRVLPADVSIGRLDQKGQDYITINNGTPLELDLSGWSVRIGTHYYLIPYRTYVLPDETLALHVGREYGVAQAPALVLMYSNGQTVATEAVGERAASAPPRTTGAIRRPAPVAVTNNQSPLAQEAALPVSSLAAAALSDTEPFQSATAAGTTIPPSAPDSSTTKWYVALIFFLAAATFGILTLSHKRSLADEFEIVEEDDVLPSGLE